MKGLDKHRVIGSVFLIFAFLPLFHFFKRSKDFQAVIFLHIPKTAGTSLQQLLHRQFQPNLIYEMDNSDARKSMEGVMRTPASFA